jgi:hypothetical protein
MANGDEVLRAYAIIKALQGNVPEGYEVEETWVQQFNEALSKIEKALSIDLADFKVPKDALYRSVASSNYLTEDVKYQDGLWCRREVLMHKIEATLTYFTGLQGGQEKKIGFSAS